MQTLGPTLASLAFALYPFTNMLRAIFLAKTGRLKKTTLCHDTALLEIVFLI